MSTRGTDFLYKWIGANLPKTASNDMLSVADLTQKLFADAKAIGISSAEIEEDIGSAYETIMDAIVHHDAGVAD